MSNANELARGISNGAGLDVFLNPGTAGQVPVSQGAGLPPVWGSIAAGTNIVRSTKTANYTLVAGDKGNLVVATSGSFTFSFTAAATLGSGWCVYLQNAGTGDITLDPNASETIDGLTSFVMYPGEARLIQCDGTSFYSVVLNAFYRTFTSTSTFTKPPGYDGFRGLLYGGGGGGGRPTNGSNGGGGGGGGACVPFSIQAANVTASVTVTIGAGGTGATVNYTNGTAGGTSSFGSYVSAYGGGGGGRGDSSYGGGGAGGGASSAGDTGDEGSNGNGGQPRIQNVTGTWSANSGNALGFGGAGAWGSQNVLTPMSCAEYGGGGGAGGDFNNVRYGGSSLWGGGGGGGGRYNSAAQNPGGVSGSYFPGGGAGEAGTGLKAGNGGRGGAQLGTGAGEAGGAPAGGGGGGAPGFSGGNGARGELRLWGII